MIEPSRRFQNKPECEEFSNHCCKFKMSIVNIKSIEHSRHGLETDLEYGSHFVVVVMKPNCHCEEIESACILNKNYFFDRGTDGMNL